MFLEHGADFAIGDPPALTCAVEAMDVDVARLLLEAGADPNNGHSSVKP